jgi:hypothetical protein
MEVVCVPACICGVVHECACVRRAHECVCGRVSMYVMMYVCVCVSMCACVCTFVCEYIDIDLCHDDFYHSTSLLK